MARLTPVHPGEVLLEEFLGPLGISQYRLAKETGVPPRRINEIVLRQRAVSADTALRLARFFGTSELFWLNLQARYDLDVQRTKLGSRLNAVRLFSVQRTASAGNAPAARAARDKGSQARARKAK
ncbi:MAG: HigA family addiction module antitoxin [Thermoanaerobaculia bacterium]